MKYGLYENEGGTLRLYRDRLEWKGNGSTFFVILFEKISSVEFLQNSTSFRITTDINYQYDFSYNYSDSTHGWINVPNELRSWIMAINNARYDTLPTATVSQTQQQTATEVLKEGFFNLITHYGKSVGKLILYRDRLEWKGDTNFIILIDKISSVKRTWDNDFKVVSIETYLFGSNTSASDIDSWVYTINSLRRG